MVSRLSHKPRWLPIIPLAIVALLMITAPTMSQAPARGPDGTSLQPVTATLSVDIPEAPDHSFSLAVGQTAAISVSDALAAARKLAPPGFVGSKPIVRYLMVQEGRRASELQVVIVSADATPITLFGDGTADRSPTPVVATYGWVFLTTTGDFIGASRMGYTSQAPTLPDE